MKTLKLTLHRKAFEVMVTGEKKEEFREASRWIEQRLFTIKADKTLGDVRPYDAIEFTNGYGKNKPRFTVGYKGVGFREFVDRRYSNGLQVFGNFFYVIQLGDILSVENWPLTPTSPSRTHARIMNGNCGRSSGRLG